MMQEIKISRIEVEDDVSKKLIHCKGDVSKKI